MTLKIIPNSYPMFEVRCL